MGDLIARDREAHTWVVASNVAAKAGLVILLSLALISPEWGNLEGKGAELRALTYPMLAFALPVFWLARGRERGTPFPWVADLLVTLTCFSDILGNRLDLYDRIWWFDDWMHLMNPALLATAWILLTLERGQSFARVAERALAFAMTAAVWWEIAEYVAFIAGSSERRTAYEDTLGDLAMGFLGAVLAAAVVQQLWNRDRLQSVVPLTR